MSHNQSVPTTDQTRYAGALLEREIAGVKVNFRWAPAGKFLMGSPEDEDGRWEDEIQHEVTLTQGFWLAETPTTQELWHVVMGANPSWFTGSDQLPVDNVSWYDCRDFVAKLNSACCDALPGGFQYAMPTSAQWEYACRAGTTTPFNFGSVLNGDNANCDGNFPYGTDEKGLYKGQTTPVKSYAPNAWGLSDMHGNVCEWTFDWSDEEYYSSLAAMKDPMGPSSGYCRVLRSGSWYNAAVRCRFAYMDGDEPDYRSRCYGFRLALVR